MKKAVQVDLVLAVVEGTQDAECQQRGTDVFVFKFMVKDLLSSETGPVSVPVVEAVPLSNLPSMTLHTGRRVIAVISDVVMASASEVKELHASAMFSIGDEELTFMKELLEVSRVFLDKCTGTRKRQWKDVTPDYLSSLDSQ